MDEDAIGDLPLEEYVGFRGDLPATVDEAAIRRMYAIVRVLDEGIRVPGTAFRVGADPLLGVLPGAGDLAAAALSLYVVAEAARLGVSRPALLVMLANVGVDLAVGSVPVVGVLFDAVWKANRRNLRLALADLASPPDRGDGEPIEIDVE